MEDISIRQFNVASHTQIGMVQIPQQISDHENRQHDPLYSRGGQFLEDMQSHVYLEVGTRWFHLADYTELYNDIIKFFTEVCAPIYGLRLHDRDGKIDPLYIMDTSKKFYEFPIVFDNDPVRNGVFMTPDLNRMEEWRKYAAICPNQHF